MAITVLVPSSVSVISPILCSGFGPGVPSGFVGASSPSVMVIVSTLVLPSLLDATTVISSASPAVPKVAPAATVTRPVLLSITKRPCASSLKL